MRRSVLQDLQTQARDKAAVPHDAAQRLRLAYEQDLPLTFTHYAPAQPLTRRSIHYTDFLAVLYTHVEQVKLQQGTHQSANEYHGRCGTILHRLPAFFLDALQLIFDPPYSSTKDIKDNGDEEDEEEERNESNALAGSKERKNGQPPHKAATKLDAAAQNKSNGVQLTNAKGEGQAQGAEVEVYNNNSRDSKDDCILPLSVEQEAARQALLEYLFQPREGAGETRSESVTSAEALRQLFFGMRLIAPNTSEYMETLSALGLELQPGKTCDATEECKVKSTRKNEGKEEAKGAGAELCEATFTSTLPCTTMEQTHTALPEYLRSLLLAGVMAQGDEEKNKNNSSTSKSHATTNTTTTNEACAQPAGDRTTWLSSPAQQILLRYTSHPIVKVSTDQVIDALLPPRLLEYFDMEPDVVRGEFRRREKHRRRIEQLRVECQRHRDSKHLMREMDAELAALGAQDPVVGERVVLLERPSTQCPLREDMERLEDGVETALRESRARCWGSPVRGTGYKRLLLQAQQGKVLKSSEVSEAALTGTTTGAGAGGAGGNVLAGEDAVDGGSTAAAAATAKEAGGDAAAAATATMAKSMKQGTLRKGATYSVAAPTTILSQPPTSTTTNTTSTTTGATSRTTATTNTNTNSNSSTGDVTRLVAPPHPNTRNGPFYQTIKPHTQPSALDESAGGSVSVTTTMNVLELNHERHVIYYDLLAQELLRQVTLDLPERGVLLAHILNEAELSIHTYDVLLAERLRATGEHLLDGQEARSAAADKLAALEREVRAMRAQKAALEERQRALQHWAAHRRAEDDRALVRMKNFAEMVLERLRRHAAEVQMQQDKERRDVHDG